MWKMKKPHLTERFDRQDCERAAKCRSDNIDARCIANSVSNANRHSRLCNENSPRFLRGCSLGLVPNGLMPSRSTYLWRVRWHLRYIGLGSASSGFVSIMVRSK